MGERAAGDAEFDRLMARVKGGDPAAVDELYERYGGLIRMAVRRRMPDRLRSEYESLDFLHDVWASFLALPPARREFPTAAALAHFLARTAENKVVDAVRHREVTDRVLAPGRPDPDSSPDKRHDTPSQWAVAADRWAALVAKLPPAHRAVLESLRAGRTHAEIAADLGIPLRSLERIVRRIKNLCEE